MTALQLVFNELSCQPHTVVPIETIISWLQELVVVIKRAKELACQSVIRVLTCGHSGDITIAKGYTLREALKTSANPTLRNAIAPLLTSLTTDDNAFLLAHEHDKREIPQDFTCEGFNCAYRLGYAHEVKAIAIGLRTSAEWDRHLVNLTIEWIDDEGMLQCHPVTVKYASRADHIQKHRAIYKATYKHCFHQTPEDSGLTIEEINTGGVKGTKMPLNRFDAQKALNCSIQLDGSAQRYCYYEGQLFEFQNDNAGCLHGYPISMVDLEGAGRKSRVLEALLNAGAITHKIYSQLI